MEREGETRETSSRTAAAGHCIVCLVVTRGAGEIRHAVIGQVLSAA